MSKRGQHAADDGSFGRSAGGAMTRGILLIVAAVALGVVLLNATDDDVDPFAEASSEEEASNTTATTTDSAVTAPSIDTTDTTPSTAPAGPRPPGEVTVLVANGSGVGGAGAQLTNTVAQGGFLTAPAANANVDAESSVVYFTEGYQAEAEAVAALLSPPPPVQPVPDPVPTEDGDLRGAQVLVLQGPDLAGGE